MSTEFKLPPLGENIFSGTIVKLLVHAGDKVKAEQPLFELETGKATIEIPSPVEGIIKEMSLQPGDEIHVGDTVTVIETVEDGAAAKETRPPLPAPDLPTAKTPAPVQTEAKKQKTAPPVAVVPPSPEKSSAAVIDVPASPAIRRLAREIGVDITKVTGSGPSGRITEEDVKALAKKILTTLPTGIPPLEQMSLPDFSKWGKIERQAMSTIRRKTAEHMALAARTIPQVTQFEEIDITGLDKLRLQHTRPETKLTITAFMIKVVASALKHFPIFNASVDMDRHEIIYKHFYHIGIAVDTEHGLLVPVLRDADKKSIIEIARELNILALRARERKLTLDDMQGSTFTITNLGGIGGSHFAPIINAPEVAILGISRSRLTPSYRTGENACTPALLLPVSLSYDHRLIDGADGARFIRWIADAIEQPLLLELEG